MELQNVAYDKSEGVGTITLNRPAKLNAITFEMLDELWALFQEIMVVWGRQPVAQRVPKDNVQAKLAR